MENACFPCNVWKFPHYSVCIHYSEEILNLRFLLKNNKTLIGLDVKDWSFLLSRTEYAGKQRGSVIVTRAGLTMLQMFQLKRAYP